MYITTSRKPSRSTRRFIGIFAGFLNSIYENRGKKSIDEIVERAGFLGQNRIVIVYEKDGLPKRLSFMSINKYWDWLYPELELHIQPNDILNVEEARKIKRINKEVLLTGNDSKRYEHLFDFEEPETDDVITFKIEKGKMSFKYKNHKLAIKFSSVEKKE